MDWNSIAKYLAAGVLTGSVFALVILGKVSADLYVQLVFAGLTGLGVHAAVKSGGADPVSTPADSPAASLTVQPKG